MTRPGWLESYTDDRERARFVEAFAVATAEVLAAYILRWYQRPGALICVRPRTVDRYRCSGRSVRPNASNSEKWSLDAANEHRRRCLCSRQRYS
jgi:hypothetical protein